jgi:hypothetical protein
LRRPNDYARGENQQNKTTPRLELFIGMQMDDGPRRARSRERQQDEEAKVIPSHLLIIIIVVIVSSGSGIIIVVVAPAAPPMAPISISVTPAENKSCTLMAGAINCSPGDENDGNDDNYQVLPAKWRCQL